MSRYSYFRQAVKRHAPSELLPFAAAHAAQHLDLSIGGMKDEWRTKFPPWFYSALARESIVYGSEQRSKPVTNDVMRYLRNLFVDSPVGIEDSDDARILARFMQGISYEQFPYQTSVKEELARSFLLFSPELQNRNQSSFPGPRDWVPVLGGTIQEALTASFVFAIGAHKNNGTVDPAWVDMGWYEELDHILPRRVALAVLDKLSSTVDEARRDAQSVIQDPWAYPRYAYNPLAKSPILQFGPGPRCAPQPFFILTSMTAENLYYRGIRTWDRHQFGKAVGLRVQDYVGRQLGHTGELEVEPEFRWTKSRAGGVDSSDWFVVTPQATILIECKSARTNPTQRSGTPLGLNATAATLRRAYEQLNENARQLLTSNPHFRHIPIDRKLIGLIVTAEPFHVANSAELREMLPSADIPIVTISLRELEQLAVLPPDVLGESLCSIVDSETNTWLLHRALPKALPEGFVPPINAMIDQGFQDAILPRLRDAQLGDLGRDC